MKAAVLEKINTPLVIADVGLGELSKGQVLVKVLVSGICGTQLQEIAGHKNNAQFVPHLLGHEGCGIVEEVGVGVTKVKKGDKVVMHWRKSDGIESDFPTYKLRGKTIQSGKVTTFNEYSIVSENRITPVPLDTPNDFCALLGCGLSTALSVVENEARMRFGQSLLVVGLGGVGACLVKAARLSGVKPIICLDVHDHKKEVAQSLGGDLFINAAKENVLEAMHRELGLKEVDVVVETSGHVQAIADTIPLLGNDGHYFIVGWPKPGESIEIRNASHLFGGLKGKTIKATQGGEFLPVEAIPRYVKMQQRGLLDMDGLISHRTTLDNINDALELMRVGKANRIMIDL